MSGIKYYALDKNEKVPYEFVVIRNVNGEPEFCASFVNTNSLAYGNGVLLKLHERNDELRAENAKLRELALVLRHCADGCGDCDACPVNGARPASHVWFGCDTLREMIDELGVEVEENDVSAGLRVEDAERTQ